MSKDGLLTQRRADRHDWGRQARFYCQAGESRSGRTPNPDIAFGTVFEDGNGDGRRAKGGRGIAGVLVSNGPDVTMTDSDGRWSLPVQSGDSIFVITPSHWTTVGRGAGSFSCWHQPEGTPVAAKLRSPAIEPTGALPKSIDFALFRQPQSQCFEALLFADRKLRMPRKKHWLRASGPFECHPRDRHRLRYPPRRCDGRRS